MCYKLTKLLDKEIPIQGAHMRARYAARRGQVDTWYVCSRAYASRGEPHCQSIAGWPVDEAIGELIAAEMTPAAVELALEIRKEIEARHDEADQLRLRAVERARIDADLAQRRFMLVDPNNRLVADTLEREWNDKLRMLADVQEERDRALREDRLTLDNAIRDRLIAMTTDFKTVWCDPTLPNRERKRLLAFCNGPRLVNPFFALYRSPGSCFCTGSAQGRHLMGLERIGRPIYHAKSTRVALPT